MISLKYMDVVGSGGLGTAVGGGGRRRALTPLITDCTDKNSSGPEFTDKN